MKTVAIIGAGPAGLVTAKTLLRSTDSTFQVRLFDKAFSVGGLWAVDRNRPHDGIVNPEMPTNISRLNMGFSDLAWQSIGLSGPVPLFPRAWMASQYLKAYSEKYLPTDVLSLGTKITKTCRIQDKVDPSVCTWRLTWEQTSSDGQVIVDEANFDYLVMASGFFPEARRPNTMQRPNHGSDIKEVHSSKTRFLSDVVREEKNTPGTVLVVGGGMSGADSVTNLAMQRSDALYRPGSDGMDFKNLKFVQVVPAPFYAMPLIVPHVADDPLQRAPDFLPLDLALYDLGRRPAGQIEQGIGKLPPEFIAKTHALFRGIAGGDQEEYAQPAMTYKHEAGITAQLSITEQYSEFVRAGDITLVPGRFVALENETAARTCSAHIMHDGQGKVIENVVGVVYATGFSPHAGIELLPKEVQDELEYDRQSSRLPLILDRFYTMRASIGNLAFVGFYEGAAWPGMELQARYVEARWREEVAGSSSGNEAREQHRAQLRDLREQMSAHDPAVPMYWKGDYVGLLESLSREVGIERNDLGLPERTGPASAARYADNQADDNEVTLMLDELRSVLDKSHKEARFVARAAFRGMHGTWKIRRQLDSFLVDFPSGSLDGIASFNPRFPTDPCYDAEYLYTEEGTFKNEQGLAFTASRRYVYRYQESTDQITVWFVKDDGKTVDYFFHDLSFDVEDRKTGWTATANHLCVKDMYKSTYCFEFRGANVRKLQVMHAVKGPQKDYLSDTEYVRARVPGP